MQAGRALRHRVRQRSARVVVHVVGEHRPQLPRVFVGDRHQQFAERHPARQLGDPDLLGRGLSSADHFGALQAAARTLDQQGAQVRVAAAADRAQSRVPAAGVLSRHQPEPRGQLPAVLEVLRRAHAGHHRIGRDRADADDRAHPHAACVGLGVRLDARIAGADAFADLLPVGAQVANQLQQFRWLGRVLADVRQRQPQGAVALRHYDAELGQQAAQTIADRQAFDLVAFAHPMLGQARLLVDRLDRNEAHVVLARRRGDCLGIVAIVLPHSDADTFVPSPHPT